jgi:mRNA-degrading endonuclease RelE of RelBE toxin-antitoxin system
MRQSATETGAATLGDRTVGVAEPDQAIERFPALRLRVGDWRIIFEYSEDEIIVLAIAHRSEVYGRI